MITHHIPTPKKQVMLAPMMGYTNRHFRYLIRFFTKKMILFTEMIHANAIIHGRRDDFLAYHPDEQSIILQLGGSDPRQLYQASQYAHNYGYHGINLNCGCPSQRVQAGSFGACLMQTPALVYDCVKAMADGFGNPVSIKCRIGVDNDDSTAFLEKFITIVTQDNSCQEIIIHARKAILKGLSPAENRDIPPLYPQRVYDMKKLFSHLSIFYNGGIQHISDIISHEEYCDGTMIGRLAYQNPWLLSHIDGKTYTPENDYHDLIEYYRDYVQTNYHHDYAVIAALLHFLRGFKHARKLRQYFTQKGINALLSQAA